MYRLEQDLERLRNYPTDRTRLFPAALLGELRLLARRERRTVTLYLNRQGQILQGCHGDVTVATRFLRHRTTNRLSTVRGLRVLAPGEPLQRGRDEAEVVSSSLDCLQVVADDGTSNLLVPEVIDGVFGAEVVRRPLEWPGETGMLSLQEVIGPVEEALGPLRAERVTPTAAPTRRAPRAILVGVEFRRDRFKAQGGSALDELDGLARTAGYAPGARTRQALQVPRPGTHLGAGKVEELRQRVLDEGFEVILLAFDVPYPVSARLAEATGVRVVDRAELILEIFAAHATSEEGRLQVKVARLDHELHRLLSEEKDLDRQAGGIGARGGPGESAAKLAARRVHAKQKRLEDRLEVLRRQRLARRQRRATQGPPRVALAGYTNAGKSTLLNALLGREEVIARDQLFTTLETTTRRLGLDGGGTALVSDTVGFLEDLPHHLVAAFEATLAETAEADLTLVVVAADPATFDRHLTAVEKVLDELGSDPERRLLVVSKTDTLEGRCDLGPLDPDAVWISSKSGEGLEALRLEVEARLAVGQTVVEGCVAHDRLGRAGWLFEGGRVVRQEWTEAGMELTARVREEELARWREVVGD